MIQIFNQNESKRLVDLVNKVAYFSCIRQSLIEECINKATWSMGIGSASNTDLFNKYWEEQVSLHI